MPLREFPDSFGRDMAGVGHLSPRSLHTRCATITRRVHE